MCLLHERCIRIDNTVEFQHSVYLRDYNIRVKYMLENSLYPDSIKAIILSGR